MAYRYGFVAVTLAWSSAVAMAVGTCSWLPAGGGHAIVSPVEFLEARYNKQIRQILAWAGIPLRVVDDGLKIYATGVFVSVGMGYDLKMSIIVSGAVMLIYTFMGGLWAVVVTDYIQFIILTLGVVVLFPLVFAQVGSFGALANGAQAGFLSPIGAPFSPLYVFAFYLLIILSYNGNWAFAQKFYSVRDERAARKAGMLAVGLKILGPPLFILPAMAARSLMPELIAATKLSAVHLRRLITEVSSGRANGIDDRGNVFRDDVHSKRRLQRHRQRHDRRHLSPPLP